MNQHGYNTSLHLVVLRRVNGLPTLTNCFLLVRERQQFPHDGANMAAQKKEYRNYRHIVKLLGYDQEKPSRGFDDRIRMGL